MTECKNAFELFKNEIQQNKNYAWSWHCNIASSFLDQGGTHKQSNKAAASFMKRAFDVDVTKFDQWKSFDYKD